MYNNECNKITTSYNDKYIEVKSINNYIVFDTIVDEDYITINKLDEFFSYNYLNNKNTLINNCLQQNTNNVVINNSLLETPCKEINISAKLLLSKKCNTNDNLIEEPRANDTISDKTLHCDLLLLKKNNETPPQQEQDEQFNEDAIPEEKNKQCDEDLRQEELEEDDEEEDDEEEDDINNQITEYKEELVMIETEINILKNIIFNIKVYNEKSVFNFYKFKTRIYNKKNCDMLMAQIKRLSERKKIIEITINDINKLIKCYEN